VARFKRTRQPAPVQTVPILKPGFRGLNTEIASLDGTQPDTWASVLENTVFDDLGRIASRKGYADITTGTAPGTGAVFHLHEYQLLDGTTELVAVSNAFTIWRSTDNGVTWSNITGTITLVNHDLQFASFNGDLYLAAAGHKVHRYNAGLGTFTEIATSPVTAGVIHAGFGRLWVPEDATGDINYSALLDGTDWTSAAAGSISTENAWTDGTDTIQAVTSFGASFLVFGKNHILVYVDGAGSVLGIDPDNMYVVDTIEGTGTEHRDSVVVIGEGDVWFLGPNGIQSLQRVIADKVNPLVTLSRNQKSLVTQLKDNEIGAVASVKAIHDPDERFVLFLFPNSNRVLCYDLRFPLQAEDGTVSWRASAWTTLVPYTAAVKDGRDLLFGGDAADILKYTGYLDDSAGVSEAKITITYATPWLSFGTARTNLKIIKSFYAYIWGEGTLSGTARWGRDYRPLEFSQTFSNVYVSSGAEWGDGEWGSGEFAEGLRMRKQHIAGSTHGQVIKFHMTLVPSIESKTAIEEVGIRLKVGRST
jgi:hypothetical protein